MRTMFPREFVEWYKDDDTFRTAFVDGEKVWYIPEYTSTNLPYHYYKSLDEVYYYWLTTLKPKNENS